jgi:hypothetical protein
MAFVRTPNPLPYSIKLFLEAGSYYLPSNWCIGEEAGDLRFRVGPFVHEDPAGAPNILEYLYATIIHL